MKRKIEALLPDMVYEEVTDKQDAVARIGHGLAQACNGQGRPADDVFDELEREDARR
jgi:hypothetical protein